MACVLPVINRPVLRAGDVYLLPSVFKAVRAHIQEYNWLRWDLKRNPPRYIFHISGFLLCMTKRLVNTPPSIRSEEIKALYNAIFWTLLEMYNSAS